MESSRRRTFLRAVGVAALGASAGCQVAPGGPNEYRIASIEGLNRTTEPRTVELSVTAGDDAVLERSFDLAASEPAAIDPPGFVVKDAALPDEARAFEVRARLSGRKWERTLTPETAPDDCGELVYLVENRDPDSPANLTGLLGPCE